MIKQFEGKNVNELYLPTLKYIMKYGEDSAPRGKKTKELYPAISIIKNPLERVQTQYGRGGNIFFTVAEILWILAGRGDGEFIEYYNKSLAQFKDDGFADYNGAYGVRLRKWGQTRSGTCLIEKPYDQMYDVYKKLKKDKATRQAVMTLHIPLLDAHDIKTLDRPCNLVSMFKIRKNKLHLHQILRSNDVTWGLYPNNSFQWSMIQEVIAGWLGINVGELVFWSDSLHAYTEDYGAKTNLNLLQETRMYDVYEDYKPSQEMMSYEDFEVNLVSIFKLLDEFRNGKIACEAEILDKVKGRLYQDMVTVLKIYSLIKAKNYSEAIDTCLHIKRKDFLVAVFEQLFRQNSDQMKNYTEEAIMNQFRLTRKDCRYIFNSRVVEKNEM